MLRNQKLTKVIKGRTVQSATVEPERLVVTFIDQSTMTVKTAPERAVTISTGARIKAVLDDADECTLQFEDGSSVALRLANPGAPVAVRDGNSGVEYLAKRLSGGRTAMALPAHHAGAPKTPGPGGS